MKMEFLCGSMISSYRQKASAPMPKGYFSKILSQMVVVPLNGNVKGALIEV